MKRYTKKAATTVLAEQILFTDEQKEAVLRKERVDAFGGVVSVTRSEEDTYNVGMSVDSSFVFVPEGDYLVTNEETGKQFTMSKEAFEREYKELIEKKKKAIDGDGDNSQEGL